MHCALSEFAFVFVISQSLVSDRFVFTFLFLCSSREMTNFQRSYSRVYYANDDVKIQPSLYTYTPRQYYQPPITAFGVHNLSNIAEESSTSLHDTFERRTRPGSLRSHDSGFNDSDHSPNTSSSSGQLLAATNANDSDENRNYLSPKQTLDRSPSVTGDSIQTPPTVIRRKPNVSLISPTARRISFSAPNSPEVQNEQKMMKNSGKGNCFNDSFRSLDSFIQSEKSPSNSNSSANESSSSTASSSSSFSRTHGGSKSLRRGKTISPHNNSNYRKRRLLNCVSRVSDSVGDVYTLSTQDAESTTTATTTAVAINTNEAANDRHNELHHSYESLVELSRSVRRLREERDASTAAYNNETVVFGSDAPSEVKSSIAPRPPLPSYDELYPPNGSSTPKMPKSRRILDTPKQDFVQASKTELNDSRPKVTVNGKLYESDFELSLPPTINWETCTYIEYTNPLLNGHASSVQLWLDEIRSSYCHEILSTLQTKSILYEASRALKLNPAIASKLINQIQIKAINLETRFEQVERVFETHAKQSNQQPPSSETDTELDENKFKEEIAALIKQLTQNVCLFMSKLNSRIIFQPATESVDRRKFERNVKNVIEMCRDLQVAADTKIDDIENYVLLRDLLSLKHCVLKAIRKVFRRLVNIIVTRIEDSPHELLLRAHINIIASLPSESVYNASERFSSLTDAFLSCGVARVLLLLCLDSNDTSIRAIALRTLATVCSTPEIIQQFLEIGGLDVVCDIITDEKRIDATFEPELREAVSVLTQVTAPWHQECNRDIDDMLKLSVDKLVTRLTTLVGTTECSQTLMLCVACLNNLSRKSQLTFYSLMSNQTVQRVIRACDYHQRRTDNSEFSESLVFLYVSLHSIGRRHFEFSNHFSTSFSSNRSKLPEWCSTWPATKNATNI